MTKNVYLLHKVTYLICSFLYTISASAQVDSTIYFQVKDFIEITKKEYAPDKRTKLLEIAEADAIQNTYKIQTSESDIKELLEAQFAVLSGDFEVNLFPEKSLGDHINGIVNISVANLRTNPSHAAEMASQLLLGTQVDILQEKSDHYRIRTPDGYIAWVPSSAIIPMNKTELTAWNNTTKLLYTNEFGKSYSHPKTPSPRVSDLVYGNIFILLGEDQHFFKVAYPDQRIAYIPKQEAALFIDWLSTRQATADNILTSAKSMLGLPYLWGGTSVKGVDCSGFTKTSFFMNGYVVPRDASQQIKAGEPIEILDNAQNFSPKIALQNLRPADLLFFASNKGKRPNASITHVALYIGNGAFIHAAGSMVRINNLLQGTTDYDEERVHTIVAARRYIGIDDIAIQKIAENPYYNIK
ncbi:C40 family peptidase [Sphingobacterium gobiense]|uniref:Hydrolase n=1 Tax=Sphingobacterium gobiense TaxID=1382456 RepID=A0A2S9JTB8_9SPHI|nr:C40 family peptidase [Sphingobacterium gobiense]PRD56529.1 hydrolase [Sphingobacterium gobiense]